MNKIKNTFLYGFTIFAMFFGSGNLVFPIQIGALAGSNWLSAFIGLFLTGIFLPFLGLFVIKLYKGDYNKFFAEAGKIAGILLPLFILSLLGSFAVIPRCIAVAHGTISFIFPQVSLFAFSIAFCFLSFIFCLKDKIMIKVIGKWMSPILLIGLCILIIFAANKAPEVIEKTAAKEAFKNGFVMGYQTMDLFAAFFFSALIFKQIEQSYPSINDHEQIIRLAVKPSIIGALLLALIYFGFVFLGACYAKVIEHTSPEMMLSVIAHSLMGKYSSIFIAITMIISCLTTAIALNGIYAKYIADKLKITNDKFWIVLFATSAMSFLISLLDFKGIAKFLAPILDTTYPAIITLTIVSIFFRKQKKLKIISFYLVLIITLLAG